MSSWVSPNRKIVDRSDLFWLAYLVFFIIEPVQRKSGTVWVETIVILLVFLAMYLALLTRPRHRIAYSLLLGIWLLGVGTIPFNGGGVTFTIYAAALLPFVLSSVPLVVGLILTEAALLALECRLAHFSTFSILLNVFFLVVVGGSNIFFAQKIRADSKLRMQQEEIEALAALAERERIARDLHDVLGHTLSVIVLKSELAGRLLERERASTFALSESLSAALERARTEIGDVERTARTALGEVREAIGGYRARGLAAEVEAARGTLASAGVTLTTEGTLQPEGLSAAEETVLSLALREAVTNIVRHARATDCRLRLVLENGRHRLSVEDNGQHGGSPREGNGLRGMRERVESLGGQLSLTREAGTHLLIELPQRADA